MKPHHGDEPLKELKHDAVPGYGKAFLIALAAMGLYLAIILISSPGMVDGHHGEGHGDKTEHHADDHSSDHDTKETRSH